MNEQYDDRLPGSVLWYFRKRVQRCFLILAGLLIGGLLASAQCYTDCSMAPASASEADAMSCCQQPSHGTGQHKDACPHHHFHLLSPETGPYLATGVEANIVPFPAAAANSQLACLMPAHARWIKPDHAPPRSQTALVSLAVLRI